MDHSAGAIGGRVRNLRVGPEDRAGTFVQGHDPSLGPARHTQDSVVVHHHVFGEPPDAVACVESRDQIHGPDLFAGLSGVGCQTAQGIHVKEHAFTVGRCTACAWTRPAPGLAIGRLPQQLALQIKGHEPLLPVNISGCEDLVLCNDHTGIPLAALLVGPEQTWSRFGPLGQQAFLLRDIGATRSVKVRPGRGFTLC